MIRRATALSGVRLRYQYCCISAERKRLISRCALNRTESHNAATSSSVIDKETKKWSSLGQDGQITDIKAAYVHIPFCRSRCHYCDFPIEVVGSGQRKLQDKAAAYTELIIREIDATASSLESYADGVNTELSSIFFGGGTPSLMPPHHLERIVKRLGDSFGISNDAEISMEADPGTFDAHRVKEWIEVVGITRLSVGVQSLSEEALKKCGRTHNSQEAREAVDIVSSSSLKSWSLDLMMGLPGLSIQEWEQTLREAVKYRPGHVSVYDLQIEEGTAFGKWFEPGVFPLPPDDQSAEMYRLTSRLLEDYGYEHYEISNYARDGHKCKHNLCYWRNEQYFGFGLGATSFIGKKRLGRPRDIQKYEKWLESSENRMSEILTECKDGEPKSDAVDEIICRMRLREGYDIRSRILDTYGKKTWDIIESDLLKFQSQKLIEVCKAGRVQLSVPEGFMLSNEVLSTILAALPDE